MFKLVHVVPVLQEEDDQSAHVRPVYQEVRRKSVTADNVIFPSGFRIRKNPGFAFLANVTVGPFAFENVELNLSLEPEISNLHFEHSTKEKERRRDIERGGGCVCEKKGLRETELRQREGDQRNEKTAKKDMR